MCSGEMGALPRFVCRMVPVPLMTFLIFGVLMACTRFAMCGTRRPVCLTAASSSSQPPMNARSASVSVRIASIRVSRL